MSLPDFSSLFRSVSKIKLSGGLASKICYVLIFFSISIASIVWVLKSEIIAGIAVVLIFLLCLIVLWRLINFAEKNPHAALFEGAELLIHEQIMHGTKENPMLTEVPGDLIISNPEIPIEIENNSTDAPDELVETEDKSPSEEDKKI